MEINREIVLELLSPFSLQIDCAENGVDALTLFEAHPQRYALIFMDVRMPKMDGYEAARRIRALDFSTAKTIPIVARTANVFREDIERCLGAGMNAHLGKPPDYDKLLNVLRTFL